MKKYLTPLPIFTISCKELLSRREKSAAKIRITFELYPLLHFPELLDSTYIYIYIYIYICLRVYLNIIVIRMCVCV